MEWPAADLSWSDVRGKVLGATDPNEVEAGSARRSIPEQWESPCAHPSTPTPTANDASCTDCAAGGYSDSDDTAACKAKTLTKSRSGQSYTEGTVTAKVTWRAL